MDEGRGRWGELGAPPKNPPAGRILRLLLAHAARVYRKLHVDKVWWETGETLSGTGNRKTEAYKPRGEVANGRKGVREVHSTDERPEEEPAGGKEPCFIHDSGGGKSE